MKVNPKYLPSIREALLLLLTSNFPKAQQIAAQSLQLLMMHKPEPTPSVVMPVLKMVGWSYSACCLASDCYVQLRSTDHQVQYEACELCKYLMNFLVWKCLTHTKPLMTTSLALLQHLQTPLLSGLIDLLQPSRDILENVNSVPGMGSQPHIYYLKHRKLSYCY